MTLLDKAYLEVIDSSGNTAVFEFAVDLEYTSELQPSYAMAERGQFISEIYKQYAPDDWPDIESASERRAGYWIDGGAGDWGVTLSFEAGTDGPIEWGDGGTDPKLDAGDEGEEPLRRMQVLQYWIARTKSDSFGDTRLHWGEWTDGSVGDATVGAYGQPFSVAVRDTSFSKPEDETASFSGTITFSRVAVFPEQVQDTIEGASQLVEDIVGNIVDR